MVSTKTPEFQELLQAMSVLDAHVSKAREYDDVRIQLEAAQQAQKLIPDFKRQLSDIFRDPNKVFDHFAATSLSVGPEEAVKVYQTEPEKISALKGWAMGPLNSGARSGILKLSLPIALKTGENAFKNHLKAGGGSYSSEELAQRIEGLRGKETYFSQKMGANGDRIQIELNVAKAAQHIPIEQRMTLSPANQETIERLLSKCKPLLVDLGKGRNTGTATPPPAAAPTAASTSMGQSLPESPERPATSPTSQQG